MIDTTTGYRYFYRVIIDKNDKLQYLTLKFKSAMETQQIYNFMLLTGVITQKDLDSHLIKLDAITKQQYIDDTSVSLYVIQDEDLSFCKVLNDSDTCDCLFIIADMAPRYDRKVRIAVARLADQIVVTLNKK